MRVTGGPVSGNNGLFYVLSDHLGSTSVLSNSSGSLVAGSTTRYLPLRQAQGRLYGGYRTTPTQTITDRDFTGQKENRELGLLYYGARFYVPGIGRFASADTIVPNPANPQSFNRYSYVYNSPLNFIDPDGHNPLCSQSGSVCSDDSGSISSPSTTATSTSQPDPLISFTGGDWSDEAMSTIRQGVAQLGHALAGTYNQLWSRMEGFVALSASQAFRSVMGGGVTFNRSDTACAGGCWGSAAGRTVTVYTDAFNDAGEARFAGSFSGVQWAIHEMGHLFEGRVNGILGTNHIRNTLQNHTDYQTLLSRGVDNDRIAYGFAGTLYGWQQSPENTPGEIFADMVIGWTYGQWANNPRGDARSQFMNSNMPGWISLVVNGQ